MATGIQRRFSGARSMGKRISGLWLPKSSRTPEIPESRVLPPDLFREIANHLTKQDMLVLSSCSSELRSLLLPEIYASISGLCGSRACSEKFDMLLTTPKLWVYIRKLEIGPDWLSWPIEESVELRVASTLEKIFPGLTNLETFTWCSIYPLQDTVWRALRISCPNLRNLSYTAQIREFQPDSELFKLRGLRQFSLCVKDNAKAPPAIELDLPPQLCDMVLQNSDLEHLYLRLCSSYNNLHPLSRLMQGTWSKLQSFHIEICSHHPARDTIAAFLALHPTIKSLSLLPHMAEIPPLSLGPDTLPRLESFTGISQHVAALSHVDHLQSLILGDSPITDPSGVHAALGRLTSLTSLSIIIANAGDVSTLSGIVTVCSTLQSLDISYQTPCSMKQLKAIAVELKRLPLLRNFTLSKTYRLSDGTMLAAVLTLLEHNPGLREIHIVWVSTKAWKQSGDYAITSSLGATSQFRSL
ncbi:hypothetical protein MSAN_01596700 [Mycena sanguinolenta]|uniref:F-box domain-containing protein n=1 Tax=Mycena sanguinolenta TaxID=230812 RepID=A0A8H7CXJ7_9AGAR|nr:hypothetical protein MSAN_01596700 [Mycena sanguinolenta]